MLRLLWITVLVGVVRLGSAHMETPPKKAVPEKGTTETMRLEMPGIKPKMDNDYICTAIEMPKGENYIVHYEPKAEMSIAHHVLLYGCEKPASTKKTWSCGPICGGYSSPSIMFAWAKNAGGLDLPKNTGFRMGGEKNRYIILQVHYAKAFSSDQKPDHTAIEIHYTPKPQEYLAGIYILMAYSAAIPPRQKAFDVDISCRFEGDRPVYPFAFRTHAHKLGRSIGGYFNNGSWYIIGEGNPQLPQAFYPVNTTGIAIKPQDLVSARCTFNSENKDHVVSIGATDEDEMCNFYMMYYTPNTPGAESYYSCGGNDYYDLLEDRPDKARMRKHGNYPPPPPREPEYPVYDQYRYAEPEYQLPDVRKPRFDYDQRVLDYGYGSAPDYRDNRRERYGYGPDPDPYQEERLAELIGAPVQDDVTEEMNDVTPASEVVFDASWAPAMKLGQVSGVSTDSKGNVWIFHRADRQWRADSFDLKNKFNKDKYGVIQKNTIAQLDKDGKVIKEFGANMFYMPHGLHVDSEDNLWLTDVALHQVFKISAGETKPSLTLGQKFQPGDGKGAFCKPAGVATLKTGEFFVADGYCNSRVKKYAKNGTLLTMWGKPALSNIDSTTGIPPPGTFNTVHSVTVAEDKRIVCVADREDGRIQCFDYSGKFVENVESPEMGARIFAATYHPRDGGTLYVVNGPDYSRDATKVAGFTVDLTTGTLLQRWQPDKGFSNPHDVAVSKDGDHVYVAEIGPNRIWRFNITDNIAQGGASLAVKKSTGAVHGGASTWRTAAKSLLSSQSDTLASVIIGALLVIPIIIIIIVTVIIRLRKSGRLRLNKNYRNGGKLSISQLLRGKHRGFDRLSTEESDELEHLEDSDHDEYGRSADIQHT